jgi:hypothetical protein
VNFYNFSNPKDPPTLKTQGFGVSQFWETPTTAAYTTIQAIQR